ncbi:hypothetical protein [Cryptosporangium arvum]|uniref:hypothetical protein n=1 Tax=Cryptosporangium arvum TaxID=80871 RepID=UPI0006845D6D|nr:hypothetical protein [Cryptosporangium arvum]
MVFDDIDFDFRPYDPMLAYAQSTTTVKFFAVRASARWESDGITVNAFNSDKPPAQGAATTVGHRRPEQPAGLAASVAAYSLDPENAQRLWRLSAAQLR